jgi:hypothetical protein
MYAMLCVCTLKLSVNVYVEIGMAKFESAANADLLSRLVAQYEDSGTGGERVQFDFDR